MGRRKRKKRHTYHQPQAKEGHKQFVANGGTFSFYYPRNWVHIPSRPPMIDFYDKEPPNYNCILSVTCHEVPGNLLNNIPIVELLQGLVEKDHFEVVSRGSIFKEQRDDFELVWTEQCLVDPDKNRDFICRYCIAQSKNVQALIIFKFWASKVRHFDPIWEEIRHSVMLERYIHPPL